MAGIVDEIKDIYGRSNMASRFVLINTGAFLLIKILLFFQWGVQASDFDLVSWIALPSSFREFILRPWSLFTYMFVHEGFFHILFNMLWHFMAGRIFVELLGPKRFIKTYWLGGLYGGLLYLALYNLLPTLQVSNSLLIGASGAVFAIFIGLAAYAPDYVIRLVFLGPVKLKWVAIVFVVFSLPTADGNLGGHLAHLGGAIWGYSYAKNLRNGKEIGNWFDRLAESVMQLFSRSNRPKMKAYKGFSSGTAPRDDVEFNTRKKEEQAEIDRILDKISKSGYESLSSKEKAILFKASNKG